MLESKTPEKNTSRIPSLHEAMAILRAEGIKPSPSEIVRIRAAAELGPTIDLESLPPEMHADPGLIHLSAGNKQVCPSFQFEVSDDGTLILNERLATAWTILRLLQVDQLGENEWGVAARLQRPSPGLANHTPAEMLMNPATSDTLVSQFYADTILDAIKFGLAHGINVVDPRTRLADNTTSSLGHIATK
jgi:hypothetical protein